MQSIGTVSENIMQLAPQCYDWVAEWALSIRPSLQSSNSYEKLQGWGDSWNYSLESSSLKGIEILVSNSSEAKELIYTVFKTVLKHACPDPSIPKWEICEKLIVSDSKKGLSNAVKLCYEHPFEARLISQVCTLPTNRMYTLPTNRMYEIPDVGSYLPVLAGSVAIVIIGVIIVCKVSKYIAPAAPIVPIPLHIGPAPTLSKPCTAA